jgi:hypothetical protein
MNYCCKKHLFRWKFNFNSCLRNDTNNHICLDGNLILMVIFMRSQLLRKLGIFKRCKFTPVSKTQYNTEKQH